MNSEGYPPPRSTRQPQQQQQQPQPQPQPQPQQRLLPSANSRKQAAANSRASKQEQNGLSVEAKEAANKRPIGRPKKDCYGLTIRLWRHLRGTAVMHRGIGTHEGEAVWQEGSVGVEED